MVEEKGQKFLTMKLREKFMGILVINAVLEEMKSDKEKYEDWFGKSGMAWLKQASTLIVKAFREGLHPQLHPDEVEKVHKIAHKYKFALLRDTEPVPKEFVGVQQETLYDLAEFTIEKHCTGCTIKAYKHCKLFVTMKELNIPVAERTKGSCPYAQ